MKCCAGTLYNLTLLGHEAQCCGSILQKPQDVCCSHEEKTVLWSAKTGFRCCAHLYYNTSLWACCKGKLSPVHQPGHHQNKMEYRLQSLNNLSELELCKELRVGTVESVSSHSTVFGRVLKFHGGRGVVEALPWPYILEAPDHCNSPTLIPGKTYFFDADNIFTDPNHDSVLQSLHFILCKCGHC
ncbi:uncharacterized protein [Pagrus major]|uniref:uncharacterized protein n=1 Tax=Pagrus major TaxID=143350 RepID=UPI003CC8B7E6